MSLKLIGYIVSATIGTISIAWPVYRYVEDTYAHNDRLMLVEMRLDQKIQDDNQRSIQRRLWDYQDRYGRNLEKADEDAKRNYRELENENIRIQEELREIRKELKSRIYNKNTKK